MYSGVVDVSELALYKTDYRFRVRSAGKVKSGRSEHRETIIESLGELIGKAIRVRDSWSGTDVFLGTPGKDPSASVGTRSCLYRASIDGWIWRFVFCSALRSLSSPKT